MNVKPPERDGRAPGKDLLSLVADLGGALCSFYELTRQRRIGSQRASFRLHFTDGRIFKGRQFESEEQRALVTLLLSRLAGFPFSAIIASRGLATIEEWIIGSPPDLSAVGDELIMSAADVLARLHTFRDYPGEMPCAYDGVALDRLTYELEVLRGAGSLNAGVVEKLTMIAESNRPEGRLDFGVIHTDFHPDNMIVARDGTLHIVDNEHIKIGALDFDLARSWSRWPMSVSQRRLFRQTYERMRNMDDFLVHGRFWAILSLTRTAYVHHRCRATNPESLNQLERIARSGGRSTWPAAMKLRASRRA